MSYQNARSNAAVWRAVVVVAAAGCVEPLTAVPLATAGDRQPAENDATVDSAVEKPYETVSLRGRVVWTTEALKRHYGIRTVSEAKERSLALEASDGHIYPIVEDPQGRAFRGDKRLRERDVELLARFYPKAGMIQVIRIYFVKPKGRFLVDYWCDICSISMIENGPCACCQQPNRLREQLVE